MTTAVITRQFYGAGGMMGGSKSPTQTADNLFSMDVVEALLGVSEGPIEGLAPGGAKNWYIGETPLINVDGNQNFDSFELIVRKGNELGQDIVSRLGGFGSSTTVQTELASNTPVVRQGSITDIDYLDIRLAISRLGRNTDDGSFEHTGRIKIEYKRTSQTGWIPVSTVITDPPQEAFNGTDAEVYIRLDKEALISGAEGDAISFWQPTPPVANSSLPTIWFDSANLNRPKQQSGENWVDYSGSWFDGVNWHFGSQIAYISTGAPAGRTRGDFWLNPSNNSIHFYNGSAWVRAGSTLSPGTFFGQGSTGGSTSIGAGELVVTGKASGTFVKELRIPVNRIADDSYDIRVTKTSPDNTTEDFFDVSWESFQEVKAQVFNFPALATAQLTARASDQFSSIPDFWGVYRGRIVKVPNNYDPVARTYRGLWDGTWKFAWSNNPAFVANDLVENDRYGMNAYYPVVLNKYDVYEAAQWCDTRRADGKPRFTFNGLISEPRGCREAVEYICGIFGGRFFDDGNGSATIKIDKDDQAIALFTPENVSDGVFTYSFTEATSRYNDITVTFANPELRWSEDRRRVHEPNHIAKYGRIPLNFIAVGCTNVAEAIARARYKLATGINEKTIVNFRTNRAGLYLKPYEVILIADDDVEHGLSGRVLEQTGPRTVSLRDPIYFEAGVNYTVSFQVPDATRISYKLVELPLVAAPGNQLTLTTAADLPDLPENAVFSISSNAGANPKPFRVTKIDEADGDPDIVEIQGIEIDRQKWAFVDGLVEELVDPPTYVLDMSAKPRPPFRVRITPEVATRGGARTNNLMIEWDASETKTVIKYKVFASRNNNPMQMISETTGTAYEMLDVIPGEYVISVVACTQVMESDPVYAEHRLIGDIRDVSQVKNLQLLNETGNIFNTANPTFGWDAVLTPDHEDFVIRIYDVDNRLVRETSTRQTSFTYDLVTNRADNQGQALRNFSIWVAARDQFKALTAFSILSVSNPPPPVVVPIIQEGLQSVSVDWDVSSISDAAGVKIWISQVDGFTPGPDNLVFNGPGASFYRFGDAGADYFLRIAAYDTLGDHGLLVSPQYHFVPLAVNIGEIDGVFGDVMDYVIGGGDTDLAARLDLLERNIEEIAYSVTQGAHVDYSERQTIRRDLNGFNSRFTEEIITGRNETSEIVQRLSTLEVNPTPGVIGLVQDEATVRASEDEALAQALFALTARVHDAEGSLTSEQIVRADADSALSQDLTRLTSRVGDNEGTLTELAQTVVDGDQALSTQITALTARVGTNEAGITAANTARADADTAISQTVTELTARVGTAEAGITAANTARADADTAISQTVTALTARVGTAETSITSEATARADADTALTQTVSALTARVGTAETSVTNEATARANADSALAATQTTLSAQIGDASAQGRVGFQVGVTPQGVTARYAVVLRANTGASFSEAGWYIDIMPGGGTRSAIKANEFFLLDQNGASLASPFYVSGGSVFINNAMIKDLTSTNIKTTNLSSISANLGEITAGRARSADSKMVLDFNSKYFSIEV